MNRCAVFMLVAGLTGCILCEYIPPGPKYRCPKQKLLLHPCTCELETDVGINVLCENTNLAQMSIGLNNLATFQLPIELLTIRNCHIARLFGSLLYKLKLRVLRIVDTPIERIEEHTFLGVNNTLNELYIHNSSLVEFPALAFHIMGNLSLLHIDMHRINELPGNAFAGAELAGKLVKLHLTNGNLSTLSIETLQPLRKLKTLDLHGNRLKELKRNQFKGLRDVEVLDLSHNALIKLDGSHVSDLTKLGWLNVSHNELKELTRGAFARNAILKLLNMSHNKITKLDANSFRGMRFLRRLYLADNLISDVGRGTFASIARIGTIDLARNRLKKIDYQMFHQLNFVEIIDVSENNVTEVQKLAFKDIFLCNINLSRNAINKIESGAFENCANITTLDLSHNQIESLPKKAFDETSYASELQISYNLFTELNQIPMQNMSGLRVLNASHNRITKIPRHTFPKLYELHTIDLSHNNITDIFNSVFQTLFSLRKLDLSHNDLESIKPSTFGAIPTLLELDLSHNKLRDVARSALTRLASVRTLTMTDNQLDSMFILPISVGELNLARNAFTELPAKLWPSMNSLLHLDLSENQLAGGLVRGSFESLLTLQRLNLSYNGIEAAPWDALADLSSLQYLYLQGNRLTKLERAAFGRLPVVFELNLAHNQLHNISNKAFDGLLQLIVLNMAHNNISHLPAETFQGLVSLRTLDLSYNHIERIDNKTHSLLEDCLSLENLNLSHNAISFISRKTFPNNPYVPYRLKDIDLSYNAMPLLTYDLTFGTSKVERLNLSHNAIADIRRGVIGNLTRLRVLDLSVNKLEDIVSEEEAFRLPINVTELYLSHNLLRDLPWRHINNVTGLEVLDVSFNQIDNFNMNLTKLARNDTKVIFAGNPLVCDCFVRPIKRYMSQQLHLDKIYQEIKCAEPLYLQDKALMSVPEELLGCALNVNTTLIMDKNLGEYEATPDFRFRDVSVKNGKIMVKWLVMKNDDIADPYVVVREIRNPAHVVYETNLPYFKRAAEIGQLEARADYSTLELCVLARDSRTYVRGLNRQQCRQLPQTLRGSAATHNQSVIHLFIVIFCNILLSHM